MAEMVSYETLYEETLGVSFGNMQINETPEMFGISHDAIIMRNFAKKYVKDEDQEEELEKSIQMMQKFAASGGKVDKDFYKWKNHIDRKGLYLMKNADAPEDEKREALAAAKRSMERIEKLKSKGYRAI